MELLEPSLSYHHPIVLIYRDNLGDTIAQPTSSVSCVFKCVCNLEQTTSVNIN